MSRLTFSTNLKSPVYRLGSGDGTTTILTSSLKIISLYPSAKLSVRWYVLRYWFLLLRLILHGYALQQEGEARPSFIAHHIQKFKDMSALGREDPFASHLKDVGAIFSIAGIDTVSLFTMMNLSYTITDVNVS